MNDSDGGMAEMADDDLARTARRTLDAVFNAAVATTRPDGHAWNSPVFFAYTGSLTVYWCSQMNAVHSDNIRADPRVSIVVFDSTAADRTGSAVYIEAKATEVVDKSEISAALAALAKRRDESPKPVDDFGGASSQRVYAAVANRVWTNVVHERDGHVMDERVEIAL
jgi:hypothetical protein